MRFLSSAIGRTEIRSFVVPGYENYHGMTAGAAIPATFVVGRDGLSARSSIPISRRMESTPDRRVQDAN